MTLVNELHITLKDFLPAPADRIGVNDSVGTAAIVSVDFFARLKTYAAAKHMRVSSLLEELRSEIHGGGGAA